MLPIFQSLSAHLQKSNKKKTNSSELVLINCGMLENQKELSLGSSRPINDLCFKRYIQNCFLTGVLILV